MAREKTIPVSEMKGGMYGIVFDLPARYNELGIGKLIINYGYFRDHFLRADV